MKTVCKKLLCLMLVAMMLVSAIPAAFAAETVLWLEVHAEDGTHFSGENVPVTVGETYTAAQCFEFAKEKWPEVAEYVLDEKTEDITIAAEGTNGIDIYVKAKPASVPSTPLTPATPNNDGNNQGNNNRPGQNDNNNRPGQNDNNNRPGQNDNNNRPGQNDNNRPGQNDNNNRPGQNDNNNRPGQDNNKPNNNPFDKNEFPGNGHGKPGFNRETVELTVVYNFPDNYRHMGKTSETFKVWKGSDILDALEAAEEMGYYDEPTRDGYTLAGYSFDEKCEHDVNRDDEINGKLTIYCEWEKSKVTLRVYTNGDTKYPDRTFSLDSYARDGKITRTEVEDLLDSKYSAKSGYTLAYYGLFTADTWDKGDYDVDDAASSVSVHKKGETVIYVMVKNVKQSTADSSNPKTGDNIMIAVTTMALAAVALVSMVELKKRKMI